MCLALCSVVSHDILFLLDRDHHPLLNHTFLFTMPRTPKRPGPLQELPLSHFLPFDATLHANPFKPGSKRFRSPSASVLLSPAKKRILREERLFPSPDPNRSPSRVRSSEQSLNGTCSPARRLDFGSPKTSGVASRELLSNHSTSLTPRQHKTAGPSTTKRLAPSPDLTSRARASRSEVDALQAIHPPDRSAHNPAPILIPRELPPSPNRQSVDYPGFDVYRDTHIVLPSTSSRMLSSSMEVVDMEVTKENIPLRIKSKKTVSAPDVIERTGTPPPTPKGKSKLSTPTTPLDYYRQTPATPRAHRTPGSTSYILTPGRTPRTGRESFSSRLALEREVDEHCEDDLKVDDAL